MSHPIQVGDTNQIAYFRAYDTDGTPKVDLTSATAGLTLSVFRVGATPVSIASLSDKAADDTTHSDGAIRPVQGNLYSVDLPDAAVATQVPSITVKGTYTGGVIDSQPHPITGYDATAVAVGANTTTPDNASIAAILVDTGTTIPAQITSAFTEIKGATWSTSDTLENIRDEQVVIDTNLDSLITTVGTAGAGLTDLGGMSTGMKAEVNIEADTALTDYDPPTRTELTSDINSILTQGNSAWVTATGFLAQADIRTAIGMASANLDTQLGNIPLLTEMTSAFTEIKGATWSSSTDTLEKIRNATTGGGNTYYNAPILSSQVERTVLNVVVVYEGETAPITITGIKDSSGNPIDLSGYTDLNLVITKKDGKVLQSVAHASITVGGTDSNEVTFTPLAAVSTKGEGGIDLMWSLRDASTGDKVIVSGTMRITKTATVDP